jgi:toxin ParE1/3/4
MDEYKIVITPDAETDLNELDDYISFYLMAPDIAISCIRYIRSKIARLRKAPKRYRLIEDEPWHSRGIRRMNAKNFAVFFYVYEEYAEVYIQNIIYQKRDLPRILSERYTDLDESD